MDPRQGPLSRISRYREASWGTDPAAPTAYLIPFLTDGFQLRQPRAVGNFYDGVISAKGSYLEPITCSGEIQTSLDYWAVGYDLMDCLGSTGYARTGGFHRWSALGNPLPHGIRKEFLQSPAIVHRYPAVIATMLRFAQAARGQQQYGVTRLGKGAEETTDIGSTTLSDLTTKSVNSYYNGQLIHNGTVLANAAAFDFTLDRHVTGKEGVFFGGELAAYSIGPPEVRGTLGKIFTTEDGDAFYLQAKNETPTSLVCIYANKPITGAPTGILRFIFPRILLDRVAPAAGGDVIPDQTQTWYAEVATAVYPAHAIGSVVGPYNVGPTNKVVSVKFQGGSTIDVTLAEDATTTVDEIVTALNADGTFNVAGIARNVGNHLEIASLDATSSSSVQWQTATANSAHTLLGFDTTTWTEYPAAEMYVELLNGVTADYT
jgi:hypothetical protein